MMADEQSGGEVRLTGRLHEQLRTAARSTIRFWRETPRAATAPKKVRLAMTDVAAKLDGSNDALLRAVERLVTAATPSVRGRTAWTTDPLRALIQGLDSLARQLRRSQLAQDVLQLTADVREAAAATSLDEGDRTHLVAAFMVVEDSVCAVEGYRALEPFVSVDEAYLAKYGLLQALQLGFDATQAVGKALGLKRRADAALGGKVVKVTRNIVAGHPLRGTMHGRAWEHFHDRSSAHDHAVIRVMSFASDDGTNWTGQTLSTLELMNDGLRVMRALLLEVLKSLADGHA